MRQLGVDSFELGVVLAVLAGLLALPLAFLLTHALIRLFRGRVRRSMAAMAGIAGGPVCPVPRPVSDAGRGELKIESIATTADLARAARTIPLVVQARRRERRLAAVYAAVSCAHPLVLAGLLTAHTYSLNERPLVSFVLLYGTWFLQSATPMVLGATMILSKQLRSLVLATVGLIVAMQVWDWSFGLSGLIGVWMMMAGFATAAVLIFNARRVRAVGPIVLAATLLVLYSIVAGQAFPALYLWDVIGPIHFVREDLAKLPLAAAAQQYSAGLLELPLPDLLDQLRSLGSDPLQVVRGEHMDRLTTGHLVLFWGGSALVTVLGAAAGWAFVRWLAYRYQARYASDQMLNVDVLMVVFTLSLFVISYAAFGLPAAVSTLSGFAGYKLLAHWQLLRYGRSTATSSPCTLLLLRVFRDDRHTPRLLESLMQRWRYLGPVRLIAATDLVESTIEPHEFFEFLNGRLTRTFVAGKGDLDRRLSESSLSPDPDGIYRIEDFFCHNDTWQMTVSLLAKTADAVLMDLRGFAQDKRGCIFEIEMLLRSVVAHRTLFLIDDSTDRPFLDETLHQAWRELPSDSPNAGAGQCRVRLVHASGYRRTLDGLLGLLCEGLGGDSASRLVVP